MAGPTVTELLVQQTQEGERLRILMLAEKCKTIEEFRDLLQEMIREQ